MDEDQEIGLYRKYQVRRLNDHDGKHKHCVFFVLDLNHDKHGREALRAYIDSCEKDYPELAKDLRALINYESLPHIGGVEA